MAPNQAKALTPSEPLEPAPALERTLSAAVAHVRDRLFPCVSDQPMQTGLSRIRCGDCVFAWSMCHDLTGSSFGAQVRTVYDALPANAMLIVATGQGDTAEVRRMQEEKWKRLQVGRILSIGQSASHALIAHALMRG